MNRLSDFVSSLGLQLALSLGCLFFPLIGVELKETYEWEPSQIQADGVALFAGEGSIPLLTIEPPHDIGLRYSIHAKVKFVETRSEVRSSTAYLEMWNYLSDGQQFFSRTLAERGPMRALSADDGWRSIIIPADATDASAQVEKLEINAFLPEGGELHIGAISLYRFDVGESLLAVPSMEQQPRPAIAISWSQLVIIGLVLFTIVGAVLVILLIAAKRQSRHHHDG